MSQAITRKNWNGTRFGRVVVLRDAGMAKCYQRLVLCQCDCGNTKIIRLPSLVAGVTRSCGCLNKELSRKRLKHQKYQQAHGMTGTPTHMIWSGMRNRCKYASNLGYKNYGGRGIKVCERWESSFVNFLEDMGERPGPEYSLDRIDVNGNYEPSNCRWALRSVQNRNKRYRVLEGSPEAQRALEAFHTLLTLCWLTMVKPQAELQIVFFGKAA